MGSAPMPECKETNWALVMLLAGLVLLPVAGVGWPLVLTSGLMLTLAGVCRALGLALEVIYFLIFWERLPPHAGDGARDGN